MVKPRERKHSLAIAELYEIASAPLDHLTKQQREQLLEDFYRKRRTTPDHIRIIRSQGITGLPSEQDVAIYALVRELAERERSSPIDFVSAGVQSAANRATARGPRRRDKAHYDEIWEYVKRRLGRGELMKSIKVDAAIEHETSEATVTRAIAWGRKQEKTI